MVRVHRKKPSCGSGAEVGRSIDRGRKPRSDGSANNGVGSRGECFSTDRSIFERWQIWEVSDRDGKWRRDRFRYVETMLRHEWIASDDSIDVSELDLYNYIDLIFYHLNSKFNRQYCGFCLGFFEELKWMWMKFQGLLKCRYSWYVL